MNVFINDSMQSGWIWDDVAWFDVCDLSFSHLICAEQNVLPQSLKTLQDQRWICQLSLRSSDQQPRLHVHRSTHPSRLIAKCAHANKSHTFRALHTSHASHICYIQKCINAYVLFQSIPFIAYHTMVPSQGIVPSHPMVPYHTIHTPHTLQEGCTFVRSLNQIRRI